MGAPTLIYCADGNPAFARAAVEAGWKYGARLPATVYEKVYFADQNWKNPNRERYMESLAIHRPEMATVLDLEREDQLEEVISWAEEAAQYSRIVVIIPKVSGMLNSIPNTIGGASIVLGYSVPTSYGATHVSTLEFGYRPVHLLGGSPQRQMRLSSELNVVSVDGNMIHQQAHKCRFWSPQWSIWKNRWVQLSQTGDTRKIGANLECFRISLEAVRKAWIELKGAI